MMMDQSVEDEMRDSDDEAGMDQDEETMDDQDKFRAWKTCREMMMDRGYDIDDTSIIESNFSGDSAENYANLTFVEDKPYEQGSMTPCQVESTFNNYKILLQDPSASETLLSIDAVKEGGGDALKVIFCSYSDQTPKNTLMSLQKQYGEQKLIFIIKNNPTSLLSNYTIFRYNEVIFNRTHHRLVPPHKLMSAAQKAEVLSAYDCKESQIPRMAKTDFIARYFGATPGDMFEIHRPSPSCGTYITYRIVK